MLSRAGGSCQPQALLSRPTPLVVAYFVFDSADSRSISAISSLLKCFQGSSILSLIASASELLPGLLVDEQMKLTIQLQVGGECRVLIKCCHKSSTHISIVH